MSLNVLVVLGDMHGVGFQRGLMPWHWLARLAGYNVTTAPGVPMGPPDPGEAPEHFRIERCNYDYDLVVAQIARMPEIEQYLVEYKRRGGHILYEIDDSYRNIPVGNPARLHVSTEMVECLEHCLSIAHAATTTTEALADYYRHIQPNMFVCHNALDPNQYGPLLDSGEPHDDGIFRIGWAGSEGHLRDIEMIVRPMTRFLKAHPNARFIMGGAAWQHLFPTTVRDQVLFAGSTFDVDPTDPKKQKVKTMYAPGERTPAERYPEFLYGLYLHAAIAPIQPHEWNAMKSELKVLEFGALGVPVVASDWGPYREYYDRAQGRGDLDGPVCLLAKTEDDWLDCLTQMHDDAALRDRLRRANRFFVMTEHWIHIRIDEWIRAVDFVMEQPPKRALTAARLVADLRAEPVRVFA